MRNRMRSILATVAAGALVVTGASAAFADGDDYVEPGVDSSIFAEADTDDESIPAGPQSDESPGGAGSSGDYYGELADVSDGGWLPPGQKAIVSGWLTDPADGVSYTLTVLAADGWRRSAAFEGKGNGWSLEASIFDVPIGEFIATVGGTNGFQMTFDGAFTAGTEAELPPVQCVGDTPELPENQEWVTYFWADSSDDVEIGARWSWSSNGVFAAVGNGWKPLYSEGGVTEYRWRLPEGYCDATDPESPNVVTPRAPQYFGTGTAHQVYLPFPIEGYRYLVKGEVAVGSVSIGPDETVIISAEPLEGFAFPSDAVTEWSFTGVPSVVYPTNVSATLYCDLTFDITWTDGRGYYADNVWLDAAHGWDGTEVTSWKPIPEDATEWQPGDFVELSVSAEEGFGVYPEFLPEGWLINGAGEGGFSAGYAIPFGGSCAAVPSDAGDGDGDDTDEPGSGTDEPGADDNSSGDGGGTVSQDDGDGAGIPGGGTGSSDEKSPVTPGGAEANKLPDTGANAYAYALASVVLVLLGTGVAAVGYRRRISAA